MSYVSLGAEAHTLLTFKGQQSMKYSSPLRLYAATVASVFVLGLWGVQAFASRNVQTEPFSQTADSTGTLEVAFSPNEGAQALVIKTIDVAKQDIHLLSYSFTSAPVVKALLAAKKRGVTITLVVDYKANVSDDKSGKARAALSALATAGVDVRTSSAYAIHHDKVLVVDKRHVQTGSFNYSASAESRNSENVLVHWNNPELSRIYLAHFDRNYKQATPYVAAY
jgi:phosphatidylserine/phosphatidylglycerophosphate/cardiolipin synthase-like enzyme